MPAPRQEILPPEQHMSNELKSSRMEVIQDTEGNLHSLSDDVQRMLRGKVMAA